MNERCCFQCYARFADTEGLEEHALYYGHQAYIERRLRRRRAVPAFTEPGPTQAEVDATLASIASALGEPG